MKKDNDTQLLEPPTMERFRNKDQPMLVNQQNQVPRVLLVVPVHDRTEEIKLLLSSLKMLDTDEIVLKIVVIDDGSPEPIESKILSNAAMNDLTVSVLRNEQALGPSFSRNRGVDMDDGESNYLWFLDSDTEIVETGVLKRMIEVLESDESLAGTGGALEDLPDGRRVQELDVLANFIFLNRSFEKSNYSPSIVDGIASCNLFLRREAYQATQGFREDLKRDEDNDICMVLRRLGYNFYQDSSTLVWHKCSTSGRKTGWFRHFNEKRFYIRDLLHTRVDLLVAHAPWRLPLLPLIDLALVPVIFYRLVQKIYTSNRFKMGISAKGNRVLFLFVILYESMISYARGLGLFIVYLIKRPLTNLKKTLYEKYRIKNFFYANLPFTDRIYTTLSGMPEFVRSKVAREVPKHLKSRLTERIIPDRLTIFITDDCNLKCPHCFIITDHQEKVDSMISLEQYATMFRAARGKISHIQLTGGEPTLRKDLGDILVSANRDGGISQAAIFTHGLQRARLMGAVEQAMKNSRIRLNFQMSVDGTDEFHNQNRGVPDGLEKTLATMQALVDLKRKNKKRIGRISACTAISRTNYKQIPYIIERIQRLGVLQSFTFVRTNEVWNLKAPEELSNFNPGGGLR